MITDGTILGGATLLNSEIRDNRAYGTAGIYVSSAGRVRNCLIIGNVATVSHYGGVLLDRSSSIENCTIVSNQSLTSGGGGLSMYAVAGITNYMANCIVYDNLAATAANSNYAYSGAGICGFSNCCFAPALSGSVTNYSANNITVDPQFIARAAGDYHLAGNSPCINSGANRDWMTNAIDLDGRCRLDKFSGRVDLGCYEH